MFSLFPRDLDMIYSHQCSIEQENWESNRKAKKKEELKRWDEMLILSLCHWNNISNKIWIHWKALGNRWKWNEQNDKLHFGCFQVRFHLGQKDYFGIYRRNIMILFSSFVVISHVTIWLPSILSNKESHNRNYWNMKILLVWGWMILICHWRHYGWTVV